MLFVSLADYIGKECGLVFYNQSKYLSIRSCMMEKLERSHISSKKCIQSYL